MTAPSSFLFGLMCMCRSFSKLEDGRQFRPVFVLIITLAAVTLVKYAEERRKLTVK